MRSAKSSSSCTVHAHRTVEHCDTATCSRLAKALVQIDWAVDKLTKLERNLEREAEPDIWTLGTVRCIRHALDDSNPLIQDIRSGRRGR